MKIQNIQNNTPDFNGRVAIIGKLSEVPGKCVMRNREYLSDLLYHKPFDLYLKEDAKDKFLELTAVRSKDFKNESKPRILYKIAFSLISGNSGDKIVRRAAYETVRDYAEIKQPPTFREKVEKFLNKSMEKFVKIFQDADEV